MGMDFTFRPQASLVVLWALSDATVRRVIERAHERAVARVLRWLEDEVAETRWASGRGRAKTPALVVAAFRYFDNRDGLPLLFLGRFRSVSFPIPRGSEDQLCGRSAPGTTAANTMR
ncbi:relaxase domain-containing protein [Streptomyces misionensis]|uniref:relaxase domain-containing protein n=1 Tax=Streptomyces misionensis TaxID=67331 RepID=UPI003695DFB7